MMDIFSRIWSFTNYAFNYFLPFDNFTFTLWQVLLFEIIGLVLILFIKEILMFYWINIKGF